MSHFAILACNLQKTAWIAQKKAEIFARTQVKVAGGYLEKQNSYSFFDFWEGGV